MTQHASVLVVSTEIHRPRSAADPRTATMVRTTHLISATTMEGPGVGEPLTYREREIPASAQPRPGLVYGVREGLAGSTIL